MNLKINVIWGQAKKYLSFPHSSATSRGNKIALPSRHCQNWWQSADFVNTDTKIYDGDLNQDSNEGLGRHSHTSSQSYSPQEELWWQQSSWVITAVLPLNFFLPSKTELPPAGSLLYVAYQIDPFSVGTPSWHFVYSGKNMRKLLSTWNVASDFVNVIYFWFT